MKEIFTDLYNKVLGFFRQTEKKENAKEVACNRLRVVLMQDRTNLTPDLMDRMRKEMVELLSKYVEMDKEALELNLEQDGDQVALMLSIPVIRAKDEEEIKAALAAEDAKKAKEAEETEETEETTEEGDSQEEHSDEEADADKSDEEVTEEKVKESKEKSSEKEAETKTETETDVAAETKTTEAKKK